MAVFDKLKPTPQIDRVAVLEKRVADLEAHVSELVNHLAKSFGDVYKQKKERMEVVYGK